MVKHKTTLPRTQILVDAESAPGCRREDRYGTGSLLGTPAQQVQESGPPRSEPGSRSKLH